MWHFRSRSRPQAYRFSRPEAHPRRANANLRWYFFYLLTLNHQTLIITFD